MLDWLHPRRTQAVDAWERDELFGGDPALIDAWYLSCPYCEAEFTSNSRLVVSAYALGHAVRNHTGELEAEFRRR